jgi:hypothetical protein
MIINNIYLFFKFKIALKKFNIFKGFTDIICNYMTF